MAVIQLDSKLDFTTQAHLPRSGRKHPAGLVYHLHAAHRHVHSSFSCITGLCCPVPTRTNPGYRSADQSIFTEFFRTFALFFKQKQIGIVLLFSAVLPLRRGPAGQNWPSPFLLDAQEAGGLALTTGEVGFCVRNRRDSGPDCRGGLSAGFWPPVSGLRFWLWPMVIAINLPNAVYIYLAYAMPDSFLLINLAVLIEQFGYGFGFTAYMLYMIYVSEGEHKTAHFAITTGFMALGMMIPGMFSGWIQEIIGYQHFFVWVLLATAPAFINAACR